MLRDILARHELSADDTTLALAGGSARRLIDACDPEQVSHRQRFIDAVLAALAAPDLGAAIQMTAAEQLDRGRLGHDLRALAQHFAISTRQRIEAQPEPSLQNANRYREVLVALEFLERNAPPALALEAMIARMRRL